VFSAILSASSKSSLTTTHRLASVVAKVIETNNETTLSKKIKNAKFVNTSAMSLSGQPTQPKLLKTKSLQMLSMKESLKSLKLKSYT
jgi:hypothetical protein